MKGYESRSNERNDESSRQKNKVMGLEIVWDPGMGKEDGGRPKTHKE